MESIVSGKKLRARIKGCGRCHRDSGSNPPHPTNKPHGMLSPSARRWLLDCEDRLAHMWIHENYGRHNHSGIDIREDKKKRLHRLGEIEESGKADVANEMNQLASTGTLRKEVTFTSPSASASASAALSADTFSYCYADSGNVRLSPSGTVLSCGDLGYVHLARVWVDLIGNGCYDCYGRWVGDNPPWFSLAIPGLSMEYTNKGLFVFEDAKVKIRPDAMIPQWLQVVLHKRSRHKKTKDNNMSKSKGSKSRHRAGGGRRKPRVYPSCPASSSNPRQSPSGYFLSPDVCGDLGYASSPRVWVDLFGHGEFNSYGRYVGDGAGVHFSMSIKGAKECTYTQPGVFELREGKVVRGGTPMSDDLKQLIGVDSDSEGGSGYQTAEDDADDGRRQEREDEATHQLSTSTLSPTCGVDANADANANANDSDSSSVNHECDNDIGSTSSSSARAGVGLSAVSHLFFPSSLEAHLPNLVRMTQSAARRAQKYQCLFGAPHKTQSTSTAFDEFHQTHHAEPFQSSSFSFGSSAPYKSSTTDLDGDKTNACLQAGCLCAEADGRAKRFKSSIEVEEVFRARLEDQEVGFQPQHQVEEHQQDKQIQSVWASASACASACASASASVSTPEGESELDFALRKHVMQYWSSEFYRSSSSSSSSISALSSPVSIEDDSSSVLLAMVECVLERILHLAWKVACNASLYTANRTADLVTPLHIQSGLRQDLDGELQRLISVLHVSSDARRSYATHDDDDNETQDPIPTLPSSLSSASWLQLSHLTVCASTHMRIRELQSQSQSQSQSGQQSISTAERWQWWIDGCMRSTASGRQLNRKLSKAAEQYMREFQTMMMLYFIEQQAVGGRHTMQQKGKDREDSERTEGHQHVMKGCTMPHDSDSMPFSPSLVSSPSSSSSCSPHPLHPADSGIGSMGPVHLLLPSPISSQMPTLVGLADTLLPMVHAALCECENHVSALDSNSNSDYEFGGSTRTKSTSANANTEPSCICLSWLASEWAGELLESACAVAASRGVISFVPYSSALILVDAMHLEEALESHVELRHFGQLLRQRFPHGPSFHQSPAVAPLLSRQQGAISLLGRQLQVIVKVSRMQLDPASGMDSDPGDSAQIPATRDSPERDDGWHVERSPHETIVASVAIVLDEENVRGGRVAFSQLCQQDFSDTKPRQIRPVSSEYHSCGSVRLCRGRAIAYSDLLRHRVEYMDGGMRLIDRSRPGYRTMLLFHLVDPHATTLSTRHIPPQDLEWRTEMREVRMPSIITQCTPIIPELARIISQYVFYPADGQLESQQGIAPAVTNQSATTSHSSIRLNSKVTLQLEPARSRSYVDPEWSEVLLPMQHAERMRCTSWLSVNSGQ